MDGNCIATGPKTELEICQDALDHIMRICRQSDMQTKRLRWIEVRARCALEGGTDWREYDYPKNRDRDRNRLRRKIAQLQAITSEMLALLREAHTDAVNDLDSHVEFSTDSAGEFTGDEDREIAADLQNFIERLAAMIEKAERVQ